MKRRVLLNVSIVSLLLLSSCSGGEENFAFSSTSSEVSQMISKTADAVIQPKSSSVNLEESSERDSDESYDWPGYTGYSDNRKNYRFLYGEGDGEARERRLFII